MARKLSYLQKAICKTSDFVCNKLFAVMFSVDSDCTTLVSPFSEFFHTFIESNHNYLYYRLGEVNPNFADPFFFLYFAIWSRSMSSLISRFLKIYNFCTKIHKTYFVFHPNILKLAHRQKRHVEQFSGNVFFILYLSMCKGGE